LLGEGIGCKFIIF